ncbi:hypothetical protein [Achromobacter xylosoxidans]|uniref:hypothetical protein n=1 Tax=Alcaligenes xylosoxydans xylosoxydans TaxID=85698 RepID=UPI0006C2A5CD|nr:hypothetical protein [Achromobacter xylosoxidans]CUK21773.1 Uncharacterised protein [Achromobacter xylosoxidans]
MKTYSLYDADGRVLYVLCLQQKDQLEQVISSNGAAGYVDGSVDGRTQYVEEGRVKPRPECTAVLTGSLLSGMPVPSSISINRQEYLCNEGSAQLEFDQPGKYRVVVRAWPQMDKEFEIENPPL